MVIASGHVGETCWNHGRIECFWDLQEKGHREKEVAAIFVALSMLWLIGSTKGKNACMVASVVGDVVA